VLVKQWDKYVMLVQDMSRNKCSFLVQISRVLHFISICDLLLTIPCSMQVCVVAGIVSCGMNVFWMCIIVLVVSQLLFG
jgi:hypothetical protein